MAASGVTSLRSTERYAYRPHTLRSGGGAQFSRQFGRFAVQAGKGFVCENLFPLASYSHTSHPGGRSRGELRVIRRVGAFMEFLGRAPIEPFTANKRLGEGSRFPMSTFGHPRHSRRLLMCGWCIVCRSAESGTETGTSTGILEPLDLAMKIDELRGIAYVAVAALATEGDDEWSHPLVRRQRMNLEQSLLVAILRQQFVVHEQEAGLGASAATVAIEDLLPHLQMYLGNLGSDAQEQKRLRGLLEQLKGYGLVSEVDAHDQLQIRPIIAHLANPENLTNLLHTFAVMSTLG